MTKTGNTILTAQAVTAGMAATVFPATGSLNAATYLGLSLQIVCIYAAAATVGVLVELLTSANNSDFDTEAYCSVTLPIIAAAGTKTLTMAIPYAEDVNYYRVRITGATGSAATVSINELSVIQ